MRMLRLREAVSTTRLLSNCYVPSTELGAGDQKMCYTMPILGVHPAIGKRPLNRLFQTSVANEKKKHAPGVHNPVQGSGRSRKLLGAGDISIRPSRIRRINQAG